MGGQEWMFDELNAAFKNHLQRTRGMRSEECHRYARYVRLFIEHAIGDGPVDVTALSALDVISFICSVTDKYQPSTMGKIGSALRNFFRFLCIEGLRDDRLDDAVPGVVRRRLTGLPHHLNKKQFDRLIASLDRSTPRARRDRALILCVARLGLRASEAINVRLEDIDWRSAMLRVPTRKTGRGALLPLVADVGQAVAEYIEDGRPPTLSRYVFVLHHLRVGEPATQTTAYDAVRTALRRAGIEAPSHGPNLLRHTLATLLIRNGASLKEIADLLGHRRLETTQIYAKLDLDSLREIAQPWPEAVS